MRMRRRRWAVGPGVLVALSLLACDGVWLSLHSVANFREVEIQEARRIAAQPAARVIQTSPSRDGATMPGAELAPAEPELPPQVSNDAPIVILAVEPEAGYRLAARLARAGIQDVAVYAGDLEAWRDSQPGEPGEIAAALRTHPNPSEKE